MRVVERDDKTRHDSGYDSGWGEESIKQQGRKEGGNNYMCDRNQGGARCRCRFNPGHFY